MVACLCWLAACAPAPRVPAPAAAHGAWDAALAAVPDVRWRTTDGSDAVGPWPTTAGLLVVDGNWRVPDSPWPEAARSGLAAFVHAGGRLVLIGHAAHLAAELGVEPVRPERAVFRWGFDARAVAGDARLGLHVVSGAADELFADENGGSGDVSGDVRWLGGGTPCTAAVCAWSLGAPSSGRVLARLAVRRDGADDAPGAPVLVQWSAGAGKVLACGLVPHLDHADANVRAAARAFIERCAQWARGEDGLLVLAQPDRSPVPVAAAAALPPLSPLVPHWGWQVPHDVGGDERTVDELVADVLAPSWQAGADRCELDLVGSAGDVPLGWPADDPLRPAPSFESRADARHWQRAAFGALAAEAHARGMLAYGALEPLPVGERPAERLVTLRFLARELACARALGERAFDGFRVHRWAADTKGHALAMVQDYAPGAIAWQFGERAGAIAGSSRGLDAADGALPGLPLAGVTAAWRDGFPADLFPHGVLDAQARGGALREGRTGASHGDWIVEQANDFVRARAGQGAAMWWRRHDPASLDRDTVAYVHGVSLEPLRAAVAMPLAATGKDGVRAAAAELVAGAPPAFVSAVAAPAAVHVLQNNWFRLHGSGGALSFDPDGEARFSGAAVTLADAFVRTRLFGGRPDGNAVRSERTDFFERGQRGEGGYAAVAHTGLGAGDDAMPPALLAWDQAPAWPAAAHIAWSATPGYHELDLGARGVQGQGVLTVALDGVVLTALSFDGGGAARNVVVPLHVARAGTRRLELGLAFGGSVALDRAVVRRAGDVGVEASVLTPAGSRAALREAAQSSYHTERVELTTLADLPGFVVSTRCERAVRNLQVERTFGWTAAYRPVNDGDAASGDRDRDGDGKAAPNANLRPVVLTARGTTLPDVVLVPLQFARHESLRWRDGVLVWHTAPEASAQSRLGVLLCARGTGVAWSEPARRVLAGVVDPLPLDLGDGGEASVHGDVPYPCTRLLQLAGDAATPFLVCENGLWQWRGSQPTGDGNRWLRIWHTPGDVVQVVGGPAVLARTRPGPGSLRLVALRDPEPDAVTVQVLQPPRWSPPAVVMGAAFDDVLVDGEPWAHFDGRTVFLPARAGTYRVTTRTRAGGPLPHVRVARAPFTTCRYVAERRELVLATPGAPERPAELPWTAVLAGPRPTSIENGEIVDDATLRWPDADRAAAARRGGVLIRFRNGLTTVRYGD